MVDDLSGDLMAHDTGAGEREFAFEDMEIGVADPAGCTKLMNTTMSMSDEDARNQIGSSKRIPGDSNLSRRTLMVGTVLKHQRRTITKSSRFCIWLSKAACITSNRWTRHGTSRNSELGREAPAELAHLDWKWKRSGNAMSEAGGGKGGREGGKAGPLVLMRSSPALGRGMRNSSSVSGRPGSQKTAPRM